MALHSGKPIVSARAEVAGSTTFVDLHGYGEVWTLLGSSGSPAARHPSGPIGGAEARLPIATPHGVDGAAAAKRIAEVARAEGIAEEHADAAGVIAGVLVNRYLVANGEPGSLRLLLSDPDAREVAEEGAEHDGSGNAQVMLEVLGPRGEVCLLYTSPSPRDGLLSRMPSSA